MKTAEEIAQDVIFADKIRAQRKRSQERFHKSRTTAGYKKLQIYVPTQIVAEVQNTIRTIIANFEQSQISN